jgi:hypothetical protein
MKYKKRADLSAVYLPSLGMIRDDQTLEGDFDIFVPSLLVKLPLPLPLDSEDVVAEVEEVVSFSEAPTVVLEAPQGVPAEVSAEASNVRDVAAAAVERSKKRSKT